MMQTTTQRNLGNYDNNREAIQSAIEDIESNFDVTFILRKKGPLNTAIFFKIDGIMKSYYRLNVQGTSINMYGMWECKEQMEDINRFHSILLEKLK